MTSMASQFILEAYGDLIINGVLAQDYLTVGPMGLQTRHLVIYLVPECIIGMAKLSSSQNRNSGLLSCEKRSL